MFPVLEWDHGEYCTIVEIGYLNGLGGYKGKSNWFHDKDAAPHNRLYAAFPPELVLPWKSTLSEIRITNVPYRDKDDFVAEFMEPYEGHRGRFVDINCSFSNEVRLTFRKRSHIITYVLNYILRNKTYSEMRRNCAVSVCVVCRVPRRGMSNSVWHSHQLCSCSWPSAASILNHSRKTFAADLCGFLAGKGNVSPYHPINKIQYSNQAHYFLYESSKYSKR